MQVYHVKLQRLLCDTPPFCIFRPIRFNKHNLVSTFEIRQSRQIFPFKIRENEKQQRGFFPLRLKLLSKKETPWPHSTATPTTAWHLYFVLFFKHATGVSRLCMRVVCCLKFSLGNGLNAKKPEVPQKCSISATEKVLLWRSNSRQPTLSLQITFTFNLKCDVYRRNHFLRTKRKRK